jgi:T5SS/PEP-CTERM-associated repeat protein
MLWPVVARGQFSADYQTNIISGVVSNWAGNYIVGSNTVSDLLRIENGGVLTNSIGYIGYEATASNNYVIVSGNGSRWTMVNLSVGFNGSACQLTITNGGHVENSFEACVGPFAWAGFGGDGNVVIVTGSGSVWNIGNNLDIGEHRGSSNQLIIVDGGAVYDRNGIAGSTVGNAVIVRGTGSVWSNSDGLYVGLDGSGNSLVISDGARVINGANLHVGYYGRGSTLIVTGGGEVVDSNGSLGSFPGSSNNNVLVTGTGSVWSNRYNLCIGSNEVANSLLISNGGKVFDSSAMVGIWERSRGNKVVVTGPGSVWNTMSNLWIGQTPSNSLVVSDGATVLSRIGVVGGMLNNSALITGSGSVWSNQATLNVGVDGPGNSLTISNGGAVISGNGQIADNSRSNHVVVTSGGVWKVAGWLVIGGSVHNGAANSLVVSDGGSLVSSNLVVSPGGMFCDNSVTVAGGNLLVTNASHDAVLEVFAGTFMFSGGMVAVDKLVLTNACSQFIHTGGTLSFGTLVLDPMMDVDGDGLPNGWEQAQGLDPLTPNASDDPDGDGLSNWQEFSLGTDPSDSSSPYRITVITREGDDIRVTWTTVGGKTNFVQAASSLSPDFTDISSAFAIAGGGVTATNHLDPGAVTNFPSRFYRIRVVP